MDEIIFEPEGDWLKEIKEPVLPPEYNESYKSLLNLIEYISRQCPDRESYYLNFLKDAQDQMQNGVSIELPPEEGGLTTLK